MNKFLAFDRCPLLSHLDADQQAAASHTEGHATCLAGPGSGKTRTITWRVAWLLKQGIPAHKILCMTFSVAAADEMRKRISDITGIPELFLKATVSTFHSQALQVIRTEQEHLPFKLVSAIPFDPGDVRRLLRKGYDKPSVAPILDRGEDVKAMAQAIGVFRRTLTDPRTDIILDTRYHGIYCAYDRALQTIGRVDFDSMVFWAVQLLKIPEVFESWSYRYQHVIVDETHDTSPDQAVFAEMLATRGTLFVVGDPSQSIYGFRGASNDLMLKDSDRKLYLLGNNYRSGSDIIRAFRPYAEQDSVSKQLVDAMRPAGVETGHVQIQSFQTEEAEAHMISTAIRDSIKSGVPVEEHAVLSRTRALLAPYADILGDMKIPYKWLGKNFWQTPEVQSILAFLRLAMNPDDFGSFQQVICSSAACTKYLGPVFAQDILQAALDQDIPPLQVEAPPSSGWESYRLNAWQEARETLIPLLREAHQLPPALFLTTVLRQAGFGENGDDEPDNFQMENIKQVIKRAGKFSDPKAFLRHARAMKMRRAAKNGVQLTTIHGAKGLEWKNVYVIGVSRGILPHIKAMDLNEERRILYVALSRAKQHLSISWHGEPSPLLKQLEEFNVQKD